MKKLISVAALQRLDDDGLFYQHVGASDLDYPAPNSYPVLAQLNAYAEAGDNLQLLVLVTEEDDVSWQNFELMKEKARALCAEKGASCEARAIFVPNSDAPQDQLMNFEKLINCLDENDELYSDITYGTKTNAIVQLLVLNFGQRIKSCRIKSVVYGNKDFKKQTKRIYDITSLILMDQLVNELSRLGGSDPLGAIRAVLHYSDPEEE